jgi:hypothetical protein
MTQAYYEYLDLAHQLQTCDDDLVQDEILDRMDALWLELSADEIQELDDGSDGEGEES